MNERNLQVLIEAHVDGELSQHDFEALQQCIRTSPDARQMFVEQTHLHRQLHELVPLSATHDRDADSPMEAVVETSNEANAAPAALPSTGITRAVSFLWNRARQPTPLSLTVSMIVLCVVITAMAFIAVPLYRGNKGPDSHGGGIAQGEFVAVLTELEDADWAAGQTGAQRGARLGPGHRCELRSGLAEITYRSGARILLQGPAEFTIASDNSGHLAAGKIVAHVPDSAVGFAATTPAVRVIDLGTEFGLAVASNDSTRLQVFEGAVSAQLRQVNGQWGAAKTLTAGEGVRIDAGQQTMVAHEGDESEFRRQFSPQPTVLGSPVVARAGVDSAAGVTLIYGGVAKQPGTCEVFSFYSDQQDKWITPLLFAFDPAETNYRVTGIFQSIPSDGSGSQEAQLTCVAGSADLEENVHTFGFFDGRISMEEQGLVRVVATSSGAVSGDFNDGGPWMFAHRELPRLIQLGRTYSLGAGSDEQLTLGRTYSAALSATNKATNRNVTTP